MQYSGTISVTDVAQKLGTNISYSTFNTATFWGYKSFTTGGNAVNNVSDLRIGFSSGSYPIVVSSGNFFNWSLPEHKNEDLNNVWIKGAAGDGVYINYYV